MKDTRNRYEVLVDLRQDLKLLAMDLILYDNKFNDDSSAGREHIVGAIRYLENKIKEVYNA